MSFLDWNYVEVAHYVPSIKAVIREKRNDESVMLQLGEETERYRKKHKNCGVYTSIFRYEDRSLESRRISPLYFDLDAADLEQSHREARLLYQYLGSVVPPEIIVAYFTGSKGFHIEVDATALGVSSSMELTKVFRLIAEYIAERLTLETIDFAVYEPRRMWRMPNSQHQKTGLFKVKLTEDELLSPLSVITEVSKAPREIDSSVQKFNVKANEWLKYWLTKQDEINDQKEREAAKRRIEMFNRYGTSVLEGPSKKYVKSVWKSALETLNSTKPGKDRNITLSRQAYRLYITLLEANMDIESLTDKLYNLGIGMGLEEREVQATLRSAERAARSRHEEAV